MGIARLYKIAVDEESADWSMIRAQIELFLSAEFHKKRASFIDDMAGFQIYDAAAFGSLKRLEACFDYEAEKQSDEQAALLEFLWACESKIVDVSIENNSPYSGYITGFRDVKDPYRFRYSIGGGTSED